MTAKQARKLVKEFLFDEKSKKTSLNKLLNKIELAAKDGRCSIHIGLDGDCVVDYRFWDLFLIKDLKKLGFKVKIGYYGKHHTVRW